MQVCKAIWVHHNGSAINSVDIQPGNTRFATGGEDGKVKWWVVAPLTSPALCTPALMAPLYVGTHHEGAVKVVRWASHGHWLATGSEDHSTLIWQLKPLDVAAAGNLQADSATYTEHWTPICILKGHSSEVQDVAWSPGDRYIASASFDNTVKVWAIDFVREEGGINAVHSAKRARLDPKATTGGFVPSDLERLSGTCIATLESHKSWAQGIAWDPFGKLLCSFGDDKRLCLWAPNALAADKLSNHAVVAGTKRRAGSAASGMNGVYATFHCVAEVDSVYKELPGSSAVTRISWAPDGSVVATCAGLDNLADGKQGEERKRPTLTTPVIGRATFAPTVMLAGHERPTVASRFCPHFLSLSLGASSDTVIHSVLATGSKDGSVSIWAPTQISRAPIAVFKAVAESPISDISWGALIPTPAVAVVSPVAQALFGHIPFMLIASLDGDVTCCKFYAEDDEGVSPAALGRFATLDESLNAMCNLHGLEISDVEMTIEALAQQCSRAIRGASDSSWLQRRLATFDAVRLQQWQPDDDFSTENNEVGETRVNPANLLLQRDKKAGVKAAPRTPAQASGQLVSIDGPHALGSSQLEMEQRLQSSIDHKDLAAWCLFNVAVVGEPIILLGSQWRTMTAPIKEACFTLPPLPRVLAANGEMVDRSSGSTTAPVINQDGAPPIPNPAMDVEAAQKEERVKGKRRIAPVPTNALVPTPTRQLSTAVPQPSPTPVGAGPVGLLSGLSFSALDAVLGGAAPHITTNPAAVNPPREEPTRLRLDQSALGRVARPVSSVTLAAGWAQPAVALVQKEINGQQARSWLRRHLIAVSQELSAPAGTVGVDLRAVMPFIGQVSSQLAVLSSALNELNAHMRTIGPTLETWKQRKADSSQCQGSVSLQVGASEGCYLAAAAGRLNPFEAVAPCDVMYADAPGNHGHSEDILLMPRLHRVVDGAQKWEKELGAAAVVMAPAWDSCILLGHADGSIQLVGIESGHAVLSPTFVGRGPILALASNGPCIAAVSEDGSAAAFIRRGAGGCELLCRTNITALLPCVGGTAGAAGVKVGGLSVTEGGLSVTLVKAHMLPGGGMGRLTKAFTYSIALQSWQTSP